MTVNEDKLDQALRSARKQYEGVSRTRPATQMRTLPTQTSADETGSQGRNVVRGVPKTPQLASRCTTTLSAMPRDLDRKSLNRDILMTNGSRAESALRCRPFQTRAERQLVKTTVVGMAGNRDRAQSVL